MLFSNVDNKHKNNIKTVNNKKLNEIPSIPNPIKKNKPLKLPKLKTVIN